MNGGQNEVLFGIKTFFVVPELSLLPEEYLKSYFMKGFETYFLDDDPYYNLESKVHVLFKLFPEVILFFNIDRSVRGINWPHFIASLQEMYKERAMIGVLYRKRNNQEEIKKLERLYLYEIGIVCGCIPIEYQKAKNLFLILNVLSANQANGQRKFIRAICDASCKMNFEFDGIRFHGVLQDISISHFSCVFPAETPELPLHKKISEIQLNLKGSLTKIGGACCLKRLIGKDMVHVFVFQNVEERDVMNLEQIQKINNYIHNTLYGNVSALLKKGFEMEKISHERKQDLSSVL
jgi:hypothetical protein